MTGALRDAQLTRAKRRCCGKKFSLRSTTHTQTLSLHMERGGNEVGRGPSIRPFKSLRTALRRKDVLLGRTKWRPYVDICLRVGA